MTRIGSLERIPFNKPHLTGKESVYVEQCLQSGRLSGNGMFTQRCQAFFEEKYGFKKCLLTTSCTDALEMAALLLDIQPGDEVIMPSYTFVSTANAFCLRGAKIVFADSSPHHPGIDETQLEALITPKTKVIVPVHYAGVGCNMDVIMDLADRHNIFVVEDAAHAVDSFYTSRNGEKKPLGSIGHLGAFSFHESKNISSGEGGMLVINDERFRKRAEVIWEKGTNRSAFLKGEVDKYGWMDIGSSFLPSELTAAVLWAQLEQLDEIQSSRLNVWNTYNTALSDWAESQHVSLPYIPEYAECNAHLFYLVCNHKDERDFLIKQLKIKQIHSVFHYLCLHESVYFSSRHDGRTLPWANRYANCLVRLPLYADLDPQRVIETVRAIAFKS